MVARAWLAEYIGATVTVQVPATAVASAKATNWNSEPVDSRVCGLTAKLSAIVNTSPALMVVVTEPCSSRIVDAPSAVTPGVLTRVEAEASREPVVCCLID
jgi:hypothetical protein